MRMSDQGLAAWGLQHGLHVDEVKKLRRLIDQRSSQCVNEVSGNRHPSLPLSQDREAWSHAWLEDQRKTEGKLEEFAASLGFGVRYDSHVATLTKGQGQDMEQIHVPD